MVLFVMVQSFLGVPEEWHFISRTHYTYPFVDNSLSHLRLIGMNVSIQASPRLSFCHSLDWMVEVNFILTVLLAYLLGCAIKEGCIIKF